ncbi:ABC transporter substrate-binding protein [Fervidobacterium sp. 2310opik-2]|uniref:ABC transporter substrate-binding protein n=1 Tax=Fervidobacterium sp. 2310opik-2 TaxID=1755815 RepID=UPI0013E027D3|nr:ABC transporter substrate-binding protein [Fervidobacterium sp. 2310opik-2]KAF2961893.1 peptide ABC transporter substrate-binding protein [Fervidobacterium sp. 2310opik-2]
MLRRLLLVFVVLAAVSIFAAFDPTIYVSVGVGEPDTLDIHQAYDTVSGEVIYNVYESLIAYKKSSLTEFEPRLATEVPSVKNGLIKDGGKTYVFPIRKSVKFHNGSDLTPEDVEYSFERGLLYDPAGGPMWMLWNAIFGVNSLNEMIEKYVGKPVSEIFKDGEPLPQYKDKLVEMYKNVIDPAIEVDGNNVVFKLVRPYGPFLTIMAHTVGWSAVLDKETSIKLGLWDGKPDTWWKYRNIAKEKSPIYATAIGTGPYKLVEWDRTNRKVLLEANKDYWRGEPRIKKVVIMTVSEWGTRKLMLEKGDADDIAIVLEYLDQIRGNKDIQIIENIPSLSVTVVGFSWSVSPNSKYIGSGKWDGNGMPPDFFSDINARKAISYVINYDAVVRDVLKGYGIRVPAALPNTLLGFDPTLPLYKFNVTEARKALEKAWDGKALKVGLKFSIAYNTGNMMRQRIAEMIKTYLEMIGSGKIKVDVVALNWPSYLDAMRKAELPMPIFNWLADFPDPDNFIFTFYHSAGTYAPRQGENFKKFVSAPRKELGGKSLDELIEAARNSSDPDERKKLYVQIQKFAIDNYISIPVYQPVGVRVQRAWVKGWYENPMRPGNDYFELYKQQ